MQFIIFEEMSINSLLVRCVRVRTQLINYQTLRWRRIRKPFWLGIAKSKMFLIREPKEILTEEQKNEYNRLRVLYNVQMKSITNFIRNDNATKTIYAVNESEMGDDEKVKKNFSLEDQIIESFEINEKWNTESANRREIRMMDSMEAKMKNAALVIEKVGEMKQKHLELVEKIVREEKILGETYITPDNLDKAIEDCLNKVDCFDFAIDLQGNKYAGRNSLPAKHSTGKNELNDRSEA